MPLARPFTEPWRCAAPHRHACARLGPVWHGCVELRCLRTLETVAQSARLSRKRVFALQLAIQASYDRFSQIPPRPVALLGQLAIAVMFALDHLPTWRTRGISTSAAALSNCCSPETEGAYQSGASSCGRKPDPFLHSNAVIRGLAAEPDRRGELAHISGCFQGRPRAETALAGTPCLGRRRLRRRGVWADQRSSQAPAAASPS